MQIKRFSIVFGLAAVVAAAAFAAPARFGEAPRATATADFVLAQSVKEQQLEAVPPVDAGRTPSTRTAPPPPPPVPPAPRASTRPAPPLSADDDAHPPVRTGPPAPPAVPPAPRVTTRTAPPPAADDDSGPPAREVPPPPSSTSRVSPPRYQDPTPIHRPAPRRDETPPPAVASPRTAPPAYDDPPPPRRADAPRRPPTRPAFAANCTQQCHLSCEASFEACNGDSSPAKPACVKKLESCRIERCSCRLD